MPEDGLAGRVVLVTGAGSGIGRATAVALGRAGARVVLLDRGDAVHDLAAELNGRHRGSALALLADVTDRPGLEAAVARAVAEYGRLDIVFANAGIAPQAPTTVLTSADGVYEQVVGVNLHGVWNTVRATLPHLVRSQGYLLLSGSLYSFLNGVVNVPYAVAKSGVEAMGRALRVELASHGAAAGVVYPGWIDTPIVTSAFGGDPVVTSLRRAGYPGPLGRLVPPERVADAVLRGMARRSPRIVVPRRWWPVFWLRSLLNPVIDRSLEARAGFQRMLRGLEQQRGLAAVLAPPTEGGTAHDRR